MGSSISRCLGDGWRGWSTHFAPIAASNDHSAGKFIALSLGIAGGSRAAMRKE